MLDVRGIPAFDDRGLLPPGIHRSTVGELRQSHLVHGNGAEPWDADWRAYLLENLARMFTMLRTVGVTSIYVGGSFVEAKAHPSDVDGYFYVADTDAVFDGRLEASLNTLDPEGAWGWEADYAVADGAEKRQLRMRDAYGVELYPVVRKLFGIVDPSGRLLGFEEGFTVQRRTFRRKGIVQLID